MASETAIQKTETQSIDVSNAQQMHRTTWTYRPNVDIFELPEELLLIADVPGANPDGIDASVESGILTVQAQVEPRERGQAQTVAREYGVGNFHRRFEIDDSIDTEAVNAEYREGTLTVHLPKAPRVKRRRIPVSS